MLKWDETDLTEFFGVVTTFDEDAHSHSFDVSRDGLRLLVTIFEYEDAVWVSVFRDGLPQPLFTVRRRGCSHAHINELDGSRRCFEAGAPSLPVTEMGIPPVLSRGVRVYVEPQFQVQLIESPYDAFA